MPLFALFAHLALCGPTVESSKELEAVMDVSGMAPDSIPRGEMQWAGKEARVL